MLVRDFFVEFAKVFGERIGPFGCENIMAFTPINIEYLRDIWISTGTVRIENLLLMTHVLFQIDTKALI
jgi:hypothetical protein